MKVYLAGMGSRAHFLINKNMKVYLAGNAPWRYDGIYDDLIMDNCPYILESYFYLRNSSKWISKFMPYFKGFLLDSGAFSFFGKGGENMDWNKYTLEYCKFINKHNIENFVELDIDSITSLEKVENLRKIIQDKTGKNPIQVWRPSRKIDYWYKMIEENDYVAISASGQYDSGWTRGDKSSSVLRKLISEAKNKNCKVHGLGFTKISELSDIPFYSVDSTAWLYGNRGGYIYIFNGKSLDKINPKNKRLNGKEAAVHNFNEWLKFQKYAEKNL